MASRYPAPPVYNYIPDAPDLRKLSEAAFIGMPQNKVPEFPRNRSTDATHLFKIVKQVYAWKDTPAGKAFRPIVAGAMHSIQDDRVHKSSRANKGNRHNNARAGDVDAFDAADYFLLPDLCKLSEAAFIEMLQTIVPAFQYNRRPDATHLFEVVKQVYAWKDTPAGKAFRPIVAGAMHSVQRGLNPAVFIDLIEEIPQLAADILRFTIERREFPRIYPHFYDGYGTPRSEDPGF
ncbi:hypothetical protein F5Y10DRAFT_292597 [Nemania abortiva]|nr:hypothetical protein F5Y10DRAFT_292597 [Nemania abortiva]